MVATDTKKCDILNIIDRNLSIPEEGSASLRSGGLAGEVKIGLLKNRKGDER